MKLLPLTYTETSKIGDGKTINWTEIKIRKNLEKALKLIQKAAVIPKRKVRNHDDTETVQICFFKYFSYIYALIWRKYFYFKSFIL